MQFRQQPAAAAADVENLALAGERLRRELEYRLEQLGPDRDVARVVRRPLAAFARVP
jgi:hypothetical protein